MIVVSTANAATRLGTARAEVVRGTARGDFIDPRAGRDRVFGLGGADRIKVQDRFVDAVVCGRGWDTVTADLRDRVRPDCEVVSRQISRDTYRNSESQHETEVEPDSYSFGSTLVSTFQVGRIRNGGAANIGWATTRNAGRTWRSGFFPSLTVNSRPAGEWARASDPVIGYDALHGVWLASHLALKPNEESALVFSRSPDGINWGPPVVATRSTSRELQLDKQWFACDNWPTSPFRGRCYLAYSDFRTFRISVQTSADGGLTWSQPIGSADNAGRSALRSGSPGVQPTVLPNGDVVIAFWNDDRMSAIRSTDGGASFGRTLDIGRLATPGQLRFRAFSLPVIEVDAGGTAYLIWSDCQFRSGCSGADLVMSTSTDGVRWTPVTRIPTGIARLGDFVIPGLGADPARPGRLALAYYVLRPNGGIDAFFVRSNNGGRTWTTPRLLNSETFTRAWIADTTLGPMVGDYISTSFVGGRAIAITVLASRPRRLLDEAVFATRLP